MNIPLEKALDLGWRILADCFEPAETGIPSRLMEKFWPRRERIPAGKSEGDPCSASNTRRTS